MAMTSRRERTGRSLRKSDPVKTTGQTSPLPRSEKPDLTERLRRAADGRVLKIETIDEAPIAFERAAHPSRGESYFRVDF
jgi:hypothetical protein